MNEVSLHTIDAALAAREKQLARRIHHLPPIGSRPLTVSGRVAGWITARATSIVDGLPGIHVEPEAVHLTAAPRDRLRLDAVLANVANALRDGGCVRAWRDELLDVFGEGRRLGAIERAAVRPLGLLTKAVHLNAWSPDGQLWIARRAATKTTDPGMWDTLVGGLTGSGESLENSLLRESNEEAGLSPADMQNRTPLRIILRMHRRLPEGYQVEDVLVSDCTLSDTVELENKDGEVSEFRLVSIKEAWSMVEANLFTREAELVILDGIKLRMRPGRVAA